MLWAALRGRVSSGSVAPMRMSCVIGGVIAALAALPAIAGTAYSKCVEAPGPAECIARRGVTSFGLEPGEALEGILRHGLVDLVPRNSGKLMRGLYENVGDPKEEIDTPEEQLLDSSATGALRRAQRKPVLAAMALVAAARHEVNPFTNPVYLKLAHQAKDDPRIPALAVGLWLEIVGMSGSPPDFWVTHAGLPAIWDRAMARKEQDAVLLEDMAGTLAFLHTLMPQVKEFLLWYAQRPGMTPYQRVSAASSLARLFDNDEQAAKLMQGIGDDVEGYDVPSVRTEVAMARLEKGYDAASARQVMREEFENFERLGIRVVVFGSSVSRERDALERAGARDELRELGAECLRQAQAAEDDPVAADWYASASDLYLRAGDRRTRA